MKRSPEVLRLPARPGHVQVGTPPGDGHIDRQDAIREGPEHVAIEPGAQQPPLPRVTAFSEQHSDLDLLNDDDGDEQLSDRPRRCPRGDVRVPLPARALRISAITFASS